MLHCKQEHGQVHRALAGAVEVQQVVLHCTEQPVPRNKIYDQEHCIGEKKEKRRSSM
jgi:hypothetical protein